MQTYTHFAVGAFLGELLFRHQQPILVATCALGAILPDVPDAMQFILDMKHGRKTLSVHPRSAIVMRSVAHSLPLWLFLWGATITLHDPSRTVLMALAIGGVSHGMVDAITHGSPLYKDIDAGMLWPLPWRLQSLVGLADYRLAPGTLWPLKLFEKITLGVTMAGAIALFLIGY